MPSNRVNSITFPTQYNTAYEKVKRRAKKSRQTEVCREAVFTFSSVPKFLVRYSMGDVSRRSCGAAPT